MNNAVAADRTSSSTPLHISTSLHSFGNGTHNLIMRFVATTKAGANCTLDIKVKSEKIAMPKVHATKGRAGWQWLVPGGAPSGQWILATRCTIGTRTASRSLKPFVIVPGPARNVSVMEPGTLSIPYGKPTVPLHGSSVKATKGRGSGQISNPGDYGYCTYGAWAHASWLGSSVYAVNGANNGDAKYWAINAAAHGMSVGSTPVAGAVFVMNVGTFGHVGLVTGPANANGVFPTMEMNGGRMWIDAAQGKTNEFGDWLPHTETTGPDMAFIYPPGTPTTTPVTTPTTPVTTPTTPPPTTFTEQEGHYGVDTFSDYHNASGKGPTKIPAGAYVQVYCKVYDSTIASVNPDGYWYRIATSPWTNYYAPANTFMNGDPWNGPYTHNTDFAVPNC